MGDDDGELLSRYRRGDMDALHALVEKYRRPLYSVILGMAWAGDDADDIFQEVWLRAIRKMHTYRQKNLFGWLVRIARNLIVDMHRKRKPDASLDEQDPHGRALVDRLPAAGAGPAAELASSDLGRRIAAAVATLPEEQREVFVMRAHGELSFKEIAKIQSVSINTALARMQYALAKLRPLLMDEYELLAGSA